MSSELILRENVDLSADLDEAEYFSFPLSPGQTAMLPTDLSGTSESRFNGAFRMNLAGLVDAEVLERAFREIIHRHEVLRTIFLNDNGEIRQIVLPESNLSLKTIDLRDLNEDERIATYDALCAREARAGFTLEAAPPIRVNLIRMEEQRFVLVLTVHQIVCDGWSIGLIMEELADLYRSFAKKQPSLLSPRTFQYADYVVWQEEETSRPEVQAQLNYWRQKLAGVHETVILPDDAVDAALDDSAILSELLPHELNDALHEVARAHQTTFYVVTLTVCIILLNRYSEGGQVVVRTPVASRTRAEFEGLIGQFVNQVLICSDLPGDPTFSEALSRVREDVLGAIANQGVPFEHVMKAIADSRVDAGKDPFRINFICQREYGRNGPFQFQLDEVEMTTLPSKSQGALFDLNFFLVEREAGWRLSLEYRTDLYHRQTAEDLLLNFQEILRQIAVDPKSRLSQFALLERKALAPSEDPDPAVAAVESADEEEMLLEVQAMPASFAQVRFWTLTQMNPSNRMLHVPVLLRLSGELSVPRLEESFRLLVSRHEILRTTFNDIDGELMQVIHTESPFTMGQLTLEDLDEDQKTYRLEEIVSREINTSFDLSLLPLFRVVLCRLAPNDHVLILTMHHILSDAWSVKVLQDDLWKAYLRLQDNAGFQFAPLAVQYGDFSVWQREAMDSESMKEHLDFWLKNLSGELPVLDFPLDHVFDNPQSSRSELETLLLPKDLTQSLKQFAQAEDTTFFVVTLACYSVLLSLASTARDIVIGSPVVNRRIETEPLIGPFAGPIALRLALSDELTLREVVSVARETTLAALQHADLPFEVILEKLRLRPVAGRNPLVQFYFLCQTAFLQAQKLPGLSIAPFPTRGLATPFEMQFAIIEREEGARVELEYNGALFEGATCRRWLEYYQTLLRAAVSSPDCKVCDLPQPFAISGREHAVTQGGDRGTSQGIEAAQVHNNSSLAPGFDEEGKAVAPRDAVEIALVQIWQQLLNVPVLSVRDTFFSLGGHSLMLIRLLKTINKTFGIKLELTTLFQAPTIEKLAAVLREKTGFKEWSSLVPIHVEGSQRPFFLVHSYMLYGRLPIALGDDQPFYGLKQPPLGKDIRMDWLDDMFEDHIAQIRLVQPEGPYQIAGWCFAGLMAYEIARRLEERGSEVSLLTLFDSWCPYHSDSHQADGTHSANESSIGGQERRFHWLSALRTAGFHMRRLFVAGRGSKIKYSSMVFRETFWNTVNRYTRVLKGMAYRFFARRGMPQPKILRDITVVTYEWIRSYRPGPYRGDIVLIRAEEVPVASGTDKTCGWGKMTSGQVHSVFVPGDRRTMFLEPNLSVLARNLRSLMSRDTVAGFPERPDEVSEVTYDRSVESDSTVFSIRQLR